MTIVEFLPILIYILLIILLVILIILGIKLIGIVDKTDKVITSVKEKIDTFNPVFKLIDITGLKLTNRITSIVETIVNLINKIFRRKEESEIDE